MQLHIDQPSGLNIIRAYATGFVVVNDLRITQPVLVTPKRLVNPWIEGDFTGLRLEDLERVAELEPDIVLLGTGGRLHFPPPTILAPLRQRHIAVEVMDTGAACRCYTVLAAEDRNVAAALLMID
jgi:uncharacterized protein